MSNTLSHFTFGNACADISCFDNGTEVKEYQAIIHVLMPLIRLMMSS